MKSEPINVGNDVFIPCLVGETDAEEAEIWYDQCGAGTRAEAERLGRLMLECYKQGRKFENERITKLMCRDNE